LNAHSVLVIEDDADVRGAVAELLQIHGYQAVEADHGRAALQILDADPERFCFIVLDLFMPEMDGWTFRARQLSDPRLAKIPVLVMSADPSAARRAASTGVVGALSKPIDFDRLLHTVREHC
jgi:CheY-like chemotaxis protein